MNRPVAAVPKPLNQPVFMALGDGTRLLYLLLKQARPGMEAVQFVAATAGEGTSSVVRDLGLIATGLGIRVLIMDLDGTGQDHAAWMRLHYGSYGGAGDVLRFWKPDTLEETAPGAPDFAILQLGASSLCVSWRLDAASATPSRYVQTLAALRGQFDLILIDVGAFNRSADSLLLAPHTFATLLVVAAEHTRVRTVEDVRTQIVECGGAVAGLVLNRRRQHIPKLIYDRL